MAVKSPRAPCLTCSLKCQASGETEAETDVIVGPVTASAPVIASAAAVPAAAAPAAWRRQRRREAGAAVAGADPAGPDGAGRPDGADRSDGTGRPDDPAASVAGSAGLGGTGMAGLVTSRSFSLARVLQSGLLVGIFPPCRWPGAVVWPEGPVA
jgi:hypothetical protein